MNNHITDHFEAGWDAATDFANNVGEEFNTALHMYLSGIDRVSGRESS